MLGSKSWNIISSLASILVVVSLNLFRSDFKFFNNNLIDLLSLTIIRFSSIFENRLWMYRGMLVSGIREYVAIRNSILFGFDYDRYCFALLNGFSVSNLFPIVDWSLLLYEGIAKNIGYFNSTNHKGASSQALYNIILHGHWLLFSSKCSYTFIKEETLSDSEMDEMSEFTFF